MREAGLLNQGFDVERIRQDFPALHQSVHGCPLAYLDNAATTQKPQAVIRAIQHFYMHDNANVHRGLHTLAERATAAYENAREKVREFLNAANHKEIVFLRGTTEAINLVASSFGRMGIGKGDEILITEMEHHANIVPWQMLCKETGARLVVAPINDRGEVRMDRYADLIGPRTRLVALTHVSNALGTVNPVAQMIKLAHAHGAVVLVDGAQAVAHEKVDVRQLDADFYAISAHKMFGPTGIGVLYGKQALLEEMPPYQGGGEMISRVSFRGTTFNVLPYKFEAGTPHIAGAIGFASAIDYLAHLDMKAVHDHESELLKYATKRAEAFPGLRIIGTAEKKAAILSFVIEGIHAHDLGTILDRMGVAVRAGHHCAMPVMDRFKVAATVRASFALYNTRREVDQLFDALAEAKALLG